MDDGRMALHAFVKNPVTAPIPVMLVEPPVDAGEAFIKERDDDVAALGSDVQLETVPDGFKLDFRAVRGSSSGLSKILVEYSLNGTDFITVARRFNDRAPGLDLDIEPVAIPAGGAVRVTRTNRDRLNLFSISTTIMGEIYAV